MEILGVFEKTVINMIRNASETSMRNCSALYVTLFLTLNPQALKGALRSPEAKRTRISGPPQR